MIWFFSLVLLLFAQEVYGLQKDWFFIGDNCVL